MFIETMEKGQFKTEINPPIFLVNYKAYPQAIGENAIALTEAIEDVAQSFKDITFIIAPQPSDIRLLRNIVQEVLIFGQHADPIEPGAHTGHILLEALKESGIAGLMINHSERQLNMKSIEFLVRKAADLGLLSCVCADTPEKSKQVAGFLPNFVAFEPPELIGTGISVSKAKPELLKRSVEAILDGGGGKVVPLCGAGISTPEDVKKAFELGARGILVASAIVKSKDPYKITLSMAEAIEESIL